MDNMAQEASTQGSVTPVSLDSGTVSHEAEASKPERTFRQSEVDSIVKRVKHETAERYRSMAETQPDYLARKLDVAPQGQTRALGDDEVRRIAAEEANRQFEEQKQKYQQDAERAEGERIANEFLTKLNTGFERYPELKQKMGAMDLSKYGNAVQFANMVDNTADVWNHLVSDPVKLATINHMASFDPQFAYANIQALSKSLKDNEKAENTKLPNAPIPPLRPSNVGTDSGVMSVRDLRRKYKG